MGQEADTLGKRDRLAVISESPTLDETKLTEVHFRLKYRDDRKRERLAELYHEIARKVKLVACLINWGENQGVFRSDWPWAISVTDCNLAANPPKSYPERRLCGPLVSYDKPGEAIVFSALLIRGLSSAWKCISAIPELS